MIHATRRRLFLSAAFAATLFPIAAAQAAQPRTPREAAIVPRAQEGVRYGTIEIDSLDIFYREAGPADAPKETAHSTASTILSVAGELLMPCCLNG